MARFVSLFATRRFLPLFITQFTGALNDNAVKNGFLVWFTYDMAGRGTLAPEQMVALAGGIFILPFFLFSATAGQLADRYPKPMIARWVKLAEMVIILFAACGFWQGSVPAVLAALFLMGTHSAFFGPVKYSLLPEHLRKEELGAGNAWVEGGTFLAILAGTVVGASLVRGEKPLLLALVFLLALIGWLASRRIPPGKSGDGRLAVEWNPLAATRDILRHVRRDPALWRTVLGISWFWLVGATFLTQFPAYAKRVIGGDETVVTLFLVLFSVGIAAGSALAGKLLKRGNALRLSAAGACGMAASVLLFHLAGQNMAAPEALTGVCAFLASGVPAWLILASLFALAAAGGLYVVPLYTRMQLIAPARSMARTIAANNVMNACFMVAASLAAMALFAGGLTVEGLLLLTGLLSLPVGLLVNRQP